MHPQDQLLVAEALVQFAGVPRDLSSRERRAWQLAEAIIADIGVEMDEFVRQIDSEWGGPGSA
ncbi:hypothetical protein [Halococcus salifodinae]|uniref:Uncharacterized protein n=1 Tax=Halococcus salifodinae DSM 8989 TaxID=1227456 RepID=M0MTF5_9EURY|nr:hypothetical protein [Halococcus salifodinae]EMA48623.1 hypothetical protein C450_19471 [Halococcus salifodinae DSM 8989]